VSKSQFTSLSRGEFLKVAGIFGAASVIAACGLETTVTPAIPHPDASPTTFPSSPEERLQNEYNLTPLNARAFWLFIDNRTNHLGRKEIARQLNISRNTLKDHISRIIRHVHSQGYPEVVTLNEAVNIVVNITGLN
jgi:DNA-binding CsgD family transcriptional regulator